MNRGAWARRSCFWMPRDQPVSGQPVSACRRYREVGKVVSVDQSGIRYPVVVRFDKVGSAAGMHAGWQQHRCSELPNCPAHLLCCSINHLSTLLMRRSTTRVRHWLRVELQLREQPSKD